MLQKMIGKLLCLLLFHSVILVQLEGLELKRAILATNNNENYIQFWPIVAPLWSEMGLIPTLALIGDENCQVDTSLGDVVRFKPIPGVPEYLQAQTVRHLLPILFPNDGCIISDIDMLPISRSYFKDGAAPCPDNAFLIYRDKAYGWCEPKYPMCYFAAKGSLFQKVFQVTTYDEINDKILEWSHLGHGWNTDELVLYQHVIHWEKEGGHVFRLGHGVGPRLDRLWWDLGNLAQQIDYIIDCHCPRPYCAYKDSIDKVFNAILESWRRQDTLKTNDLK